ncbi:MAG: DUF2029 domain-containing protein [Ruminiclostridium sp.]|nr:DUF2029 domain-containing protein [Ruminiclostridium sp.]
MNWDQFQNTIDNLWINRKADKVSALLDNKRFQSLVFFLIFICGILVRLWKFGVIPAGFNQDGAMGAVDALALANHGTDRFGMWLPVHFTAWGFGQMSVLLSYLSIPFIGIFGLNRITARIAVLIVSLLSLWVIYLLSRLIFSKKTVLVVLAFSAINPWHIMQSRWALDCNMFPHFLLFSVYFLCLGLKKKKIYIYLSMVFFGITMYSYGIAWYSVPLMLLAVFIYLLKTKRLSLKDTFFSALAYMLVAWPIFGVMIINLLKFPTIATPFFTIPFFPGTTRMSDLLFFSTNIFAQFINNIKAFINVVILQKPDLPWNTIPQFGIIYLFSIPFVIIGLITLIKMIRSKKAKAAETAVPAIGPLLENNGRVLAVIVMIWLLVAVISGLIINNINVNRINIIAYPLIILAALGIELIIRKIKLLSLVILSIYLIAFASFNISYFGEHSKVLANSFYYGFGEALESVQDLEYDRIYVTSHTQSENSWWVSEPLTMFYHDIDALYFQGKGDAFSKSGKPLLPYKERYKYVKFSDLKIDPLEKAVYIIHKSDDLSFDPGSFTLYRFADYFAVIPNSHANIAVKADLEAKSRNFPDNESSVKKEVAITRMTAANGYNTGILVFVGIYLLGVLLAWSAVKKREMPLIKEQENFYLYILLSTALFIRILLAPIIEGWPNDIAANKYWASAAAKSLTNFYNSGWCDYPPLFIYVLSIVGKLTSVFQNYSTLLIKLPSMIADLITAWLIYRIARSRLKIRYALLACAAYAFHPAVIVDSAIWGQVDSFFTMIVVAALMFHMRKKHGMAAVFFAAAVLMKPQGIFFLPILLFELIKQRSLKYFFTVFSAGFATVLVVIFPFALNQEPLWIFKLYLNTAGEYPSIVMNAFNIFSLAGANFKDGSIVPFLFSYNTWGLIFTILVLIIAGYFYLKSKHEATPILTAVILNSGAFIFAPKMHERYMFPVIALILIALIYLENKKILLLLIGFSLTIFMNIHVLFYRMLMFDVTGAHMVGAEIYPVVFAFSLLNVLLFAYLVKTGRELILLEG